MADGVTLEGAPVLGVKIHAVERYQAADLILEAARDRRPMAVSALAVHGVMEGVADPELQYRLNRFELVVADGQPVRWAVNLLHGAGLQDRVCGPDLMADLCKAAAVDGLPIFLFGSTQSTLDLLADRLPRLAPGLRVAGTQASRFRAATEQERLADLEVIRDSGAALVFVGLGCPRQEIWAFENRVELGLPVVAVGAAFEFFAGNLDRAPAWMQKAGLEWLYRLRQEPRRLWRRYLILNPAYLFRLGLELTGIRRIPTDRQVRPPLAQRPS